MYTRSYGSRPGITSRPIPPDYGGTALVIPQPEPEPAPPPRPEPPVVPTPPLSSEQSPMPGATPPSPPAGRPSPGEAPPQGIRPPRRARPSSPRFSGRRNPVMTAPSMPTPPDYDPRRPEEAKPSPDDRRDPLGAPPFGGLGIPPLGSPGNPSLGSPGNPPLGSLGSPPLGSPPLGAFTDLLDGKEPSEGAARSFSDPAPSEAVSADGTQSHSPLPFSILALRQDDLLLLGLLLFLLHEQDDGETDCRDALLLLAVLFVAGM